MIQYLDLSEFHLHPQEGGRPYFVFDPKSDKEYDQLAKLVHIDEVEQTILAEGTEQLETEGGDLRESADWSRIYKATALDPDTHTELKTKRGESIYVFMAIMMKGRQVHKNLGSFPVFR